MSSFPGPTANTHFAPRPPPFLSPFHALPPGFSPASLIGMPPALVSTIAMGGGILQNPGGPLQAVLLPPPIVQPAPVSSSSQATARRVLEGLPWPSKVINHYFQFL